MFKIFIDGTLYKITKSEKAMEAIINNFCKDYQPGRFLIVEKDGKIVYEFCWHF